MEQTTGIFGEKLSNGGNVKHRLFQAPALKPAPSFEKSGKTISMGSEAMRSVL
jgi:hypothetical protein